MRISFAVIFRYWFAFNYMIGLCCIVLVYYLARKVFSAVIISIETYICFHDGGECEKRKYEWECNICVYFAN